ncbi:MAG: hypothetical protein EBU49_02315 [Proteobacteria bacterium]|nr:hypothetical protein [Pseudomonadota bacterium]
MDCYSFFLLHVTIKKTYGVVVKNIHLLSLVAVAISSVASACGKNDSAALDAMADLDGTWVEACSADSDGGGGSSKSSVTYSGGDVTGITPNYGDPSCTTETYTIKFVATYKGGSSVVSPAGAKELDVTPVKLVLNVKTDDLVEAFNGVAGNTPLCGGGFVKNTDKDLSATDCANDVDLKKVFEPVYSIYKIEGSKRYGGLCGDAGSADDCTTPAKRATTLDTEYLTKG